MYWLLDEKIQDLIRDWSARTVLMAACIFCHRAAMLSCTMRPPTSLQALLWKIRLLFPLKKPWHADFP